jgi:hypothetical protein
MRLWLLGLVLFQWTASEGRNLAPGRSASSFDCTKFDSNSGARFDLRELQRSAGQPSYRVEDGDIPCTKYVSVALLMKYFHRLSGMELSFFLTFHVTTTFPPIFNNY